MDRSGRRLVARWLDRRRLRDRFDRSRRFGRRKNRLPCHLRRSRRRGRWFLGYRGLLGGFDLGWRWRLGLRLRLGVGLRVGLGLRFAGRDGHARRFGGFLAVFRCWPTVISALRFQGIGDREPADDRLGQDGRHFHREDDVAELHFVSRAQRRGFGDLLAVDIRAIGAFQIGDHQTAGVALESSMLPTDARAGQHQGTVRGPSDQIGQGLDLDPLAIRSDQRELHHRIPPDREGQAMAFPCGCSFVDQGPRPRQRRPVPDRPEKV